MSKLRVISKGELANILLDHKLWLESDRDEGQRADLSYTDLSNVDLSDMDLRYINLAGSDLTKANLSCSDLSYAALSKAELDQTKLCHAKCIKAGFIQANFRRNDLRYTDFSGANLYRALLDKVELIGAILHDADLEGAVLDSIHDKEILTFQAGKHFAYYCDGYIKIGCTVKPTGWWVENYKIIGKGEDYSNYSLKMYGTFIKLCNEISKDNELQQVG